MSTHPASPIRLAVGGGDDNRVDMPNFTMHHAASDAASGDDTGGSDGGADYKVGLAPLASMEDISLLATPMPTPMSTPGQTPGASPRAARANRKAPYQQPTIPEETDHHDEEKEHRPLPNATGRFSSPARRNNLLKESLINRAYSPPDRWGQHQSHIPMAEETLEHEQHPAHPLSQFTTSTPIRANGEEEGGFCSATEFNNNSRSGGGRMEKEVLLSSSPSAPTTVQFLSPRMGSVKGSSGGGVPKGYGLRARAAESEADVMAMESWPPRDRFNLIYLTMVLHGIGTLIPWNMFITAKEYFVEYKLSTSYTRSDSLNYATYFILIVTLAAQVPNVVFNWLNVFLNIRTLTSRVVWTLFIEVVIFVVTIILAMIDTSTWPGIFFQITIFSIVVLNIVNGIYQNTVYGLAAKLPFKYTGAVVLGSNLSGTVVALINLACIYLAPNARTAAIYYFITALFILLACFDTYFALPLNRFFRYHDHLYNTALQQKKDRSVIHAIPYVHVFKSSFPQCFNVFFTFFVTLSIYPALHSEIRQAHREFPVDAKYFTAVTCFLTFNLCAVAGNILPSYGFRWPCPRWLFVPVLLRFLLVPFFLLCNYRPADAERLWPVLVHSDWAYWAGAAVLGVTGGYLSSMAMMFCPRSVEPEYASTAGMFGAASIVTGIFAGIAFSFCMPVLISHPALQFSAPSWWPHYEGSYS